MTYSTTYYTQSSVENIEEIVVEVCKQVGLTVDKEAGDQIEKDTEASVIYISSHDIELLAEYNVESDRNPKPELSVTNVFSLLDRPMDEREYKQSVDSFYELICRLTIAIEADYVVMYACDPPREAWPTGRPIGETVTEVPIFGIYSESVLDQLGGLEQMFRRSPWYVAQLTSGHTVVIEDEFIQSDHEWRPPTDAEFLEAAEFSDASASTSVEPSGLSDPFAALETGAIGTDVCVSRDEIAPQFDNENLQLVRVRIDEQRNLRRLDDDSFVRNVVDDPADDQLTLVKGMLSDIPTDGVEQNLMVSALLHEDIPPSFVRLDHPDGETIASKVLALETNANKYELLSSLGRVTQQDDFTENDLQTIHGALDTLAELDDSDQIDEFIDQELL